MTRRKSVAAERNDPLLAPLKIRHLTLRNRIMSTSHACGLEEGGMPTERYQLYHEEKAKGGIALTMFGGSSNVGRRVAEHFPTTQRRHRRDHPAPAAVLRARARAWCGASCARSRISAGAVNPMPSNWLPTIAPSAHPRDAAPQLPEGDGRARHRPRRQGLRCCGQAVPGGRPRRHRNARRRPSDRPVSVAQAPIGAPTGSAARVENRCRFGLMVLRGDPPAGRRQVPASACAT